MKCDFSVMQDSLQEAGCLKVNLCLVKKYDSIVKSMKKIKKNEGSRMPESRFKFGTKVRKHKIGLERGEMLLGINQGLN